MTGNVAPASKNAVSSPAALDQAVAAVVQRKRAFARLPVAEKIALLRATAPLLNAVSGDWVAAACRAKGIPLDSPTAGEEWLAGPAPSARNIRLLVDSLLQIARQGRPQLGRKVRTRPDGRVEVEVLPVGGWDTTLYRGLSCWVRLQPGIDEAGARQQQAAFYQESQPEGKVSLILGAGNVSSIPVMDVLYKMFVDGSVCLLKMNPVNEWVGPFLEQALAPLIAAGFLRIVYGGAEEGEYLCQHRDVDDIHITGSDKTHDRIVWGAPGTEQERRKRQGAPLLAKPITSELGNVSPVAIVPGKFSDKELWFQARNLTTMLVNNGSFNCNGAKVLITARGWPQRDRFLELFRKAMGQARTRKAYYPGARQRYEEMVAGRNAVQYFGSPEPESLPWAFIPDVDSSRADERLFRVEAFCGLLGHTEVGEADPALFLATVTDFCNDRLWGTLNAALIIDGKSEADPTIARALDRAVTELRYGTVAINLWPAVGYGTVSPPWGGHPSATLANIQSGLGWVHNTFMLGGIEKSIVRGPVVLAPKPAWYFDNKQCNVIGQKLAAFETHPRALNVPSLVLAALRG
ncbi:MAG TPA: aldehyde dehydrogenase family protein [Polyangia bacterium]|nr:aldehyde dehydrogenase family protein [Polyangia bacterium]